MVDILPDDDQYCVLEYGIQDDCSIVVEEGIDEDEFVMQRQMVS